MFFFPIIPILAVHDIPDNNKLEQWIVEVATGDSNALENLYLKTKSAVYGYALSLLKNTHDAEDVLHDCFVNVWSAAASYKPKDKPMAWLITITKNLCFDRLRVTQKYGDMPDEEHDISFTEREDITPEDKWLLKEFIATLSDDERQIITLHAISGLKHREIAGILDLALPTVLSKYRRGLMKLKAKYEKEGI